MKNHSFTDMWRSLSSFVDRWIGSTLVDEMVFDPHLHSKGVRGQMCVSTQHQIILDGPTSICGLIALGWCMSEFNALWICFFCLFWDNRINNWLRLFICFCNYHQLKLHLQFLHNSFSIYKQIILKLYMCSLFVKHYCRSALPPHPLCAEILWPFTELLW